jgi:Zn-finger nucleic acid-binding protein
MNPALLTIADALRNAPTVGATLGSIPENSQWSCPVCKTTMRVERTQGILVDVCTEHGVWFDLGEVPALVAKIQAGQRVGLAEQLDNAKRKGIVSGAFMGLIALWLDKDN